MTDWYCTAEDVRRVLRQKDLPADAQQDRQIVTDAIAAQTEWLEKRLKRHWFDPNTGVGGVASDSKTRDDEHDLPTHGGFVHGRSEHDRHRYRRNSDALLEAGPRHERRRRHFTEPKREIRLAFGREYEPDLPAETPLYTNITLDRRDVISVNELHVVTRDGTFVDWVADSSFDGGVGTTHRGEDYWVRVNNGGVSELYLDVTSMDDDLPSLSNAVYIDFEYGHEGIPGTLSRAVAYRAAADLTEEAAMQIPDNARLKNVDSLSDELREKAEELLDVYEVEM